MAPFTADVVRRCRTCRAEVVWCHTAGGKSMPIDAQPVPDGNVLVDDGARGLVATVVPAGQVTFDDRPLYVSHFATCPDADTHRRPR